MGLGKLYILKTDRSEQATSPVTSQITHLTLIRDKQVRTMSTSLLNVTMNDESMAWVFFLFWRMWFSSAMVVREGVKNLWLRRSRYVRNEQQK